MEIICDTNIWYGLGSGRIDRSKIKENDILIATYISIEELALSDNVLYSFEKIKNAINAICRLSKHTILEPPFIHLKVTSDKNYCCDLDSFRELFIFTEKIGMSYTIEEDKREDFKNSFTEKRKQLLIEDTDYINNYVQTNIILKTKEARKRHREEDSIPANRELINYFVARDTKSDGLSDDFDWKQIELFEKVMKLFLNEIETGAKVMDENDWYDLFLLAYVNPQRKIWTKERKWKRLIKEAGFEDYLYE